MGTHYDLEYYGLRLEPSLFGVEVEKKEGNEVQKYDAVHEYRYL